MKHIVIIRTAGSYIDYNTYNCQELGLSKALVKRGYKVSLVMAGPQKENFKYNVNGKYIDIYYLKYIGIHQTLCLFLGLKKLLKILDPDVVQIHEFGMFMSFVVAKWAKRNGVRCVLIEGDYKLTNKKWRREYEMLYNETLGYSTLKNVSAIGCKTKAASHYVATYSKKETFLTPVGLDIDKFSNKKNDCDIRKKYGIEGKKILIYIGVMKPRRHPLFLLSLMKEMPDDYVLLMIGVGPLENEMKAYIEKNNLKNVIMLGRKNQDELPSYYEASDLFLLASEYEILGMVIMESMYFGTPLVSSLTAGSQTLVSDETGVIISDYNIAKWRNVITDICSKKWKLEKMSNMCKKKMSESYIWDKAVENYLHLYNI